MDDFLIEFEDFSSAEVKTFANKLLSLKEAKRNVFQAWKADYSTKIMLNLELDKRLH